ncbi:ATP-binding protein [Geminocystis herdmanii]|uniref:ATP-binding protein n=1 Tax=Geminocystis herdmanii TaxID=669359 RepID=UPI00034DF1F3|nr:ATP-binding protein [Geminocystis herdmanii]
MLKKIDNHNFHLETVSNLDEVENLLNWFEKQYQSHIPDKIWLQAQTVLIEGFTNAVRHAHEHHEQETLISLQLEINPHHLQIKIWDQGTFFDLTSALENLHTKISCNEIDLFERESQWGFIFFLKLRDEFGWSIDYTPAGQHNCMEFRSPNFYNI